MLAKYEKYWSGLCVVVIICKARLVSACWQFVKCHMIFNPHVEDWKMNDLVWFVCLMGHQTFMDHLMLI